MPSDRNDGRLSAGRAVNRAGLCSAAVRVDPVAEPSRLAVGRECCVDPGGQSVEGRVTVGALSDGIDPGAVLVVVGERWACDLDSQLITMISCPRGLIVYDLGRFPCWEEFELPFCVT